MKRTAIIAAWLASLIAAFLAGRAGIDAVDARTEAVSSVTAIQRLRFDTGAGPGAGDQSGPLKTPDPVALAQDLVGEGKPHDALALLADYFAGNHSPGTEHFSQALFLLSDLKQMTGEVEGALEPLLAILRYPPSEATARRARQRLDLLINAREQQLINAGDLVGLVSYFEMLTAAEPGYDGHRLKLARWLLRSDRADEAAALVRETGLNGVSQAEIDALHGEIELARTSLAVEHEGGAMYTGATVMGAAAKRNFRFLIDTGATMTGLAETALESLGAVRIEEGIRVQTANGVVRLPVYRVKEVALGALVLRDLAVLGFADLPRGADGLLGMDVLHRLPGGVPGAVGSPGKPR